MNPIIRLFSELAQLNTCLGMRDFWRYVGCVVSRLAAIIETHSLAPADLAMGGIVHVKVKGKWIVIPLDKMRDILSHHDATPTFGSIREMYGCDVYLRAFRPDVKAETVVDLGSNRGLFLVLAERVLEADLAIGVEPQQFYDAAFWAMVEANGMNRRSFRRIGKFASSTNEPEQIMVQEIFEKNAISSINFLKCDIEGGEFDIFLKNNRFLHHVDNIAIELHPEKGDVRRLMAELNAFGFRVRVTDQFGRSAAAEKGHYLYASRTGGLLVGH